MLFYKTCTLFYNSHLAGDILLILCVLSMLYGVCGTFIYDNLKEKALSINMFVWGGVISYSLFTHMDIFPYWSGIIVLYFLFNLWLAEISLSCSDEFYISRLGGMWRKLPLLLLTGVLLSIALFQNIFVLKDIPIFLQYGMIGLMLLIFTYLTRQIFFGPNMSDDKVWAFMKHPPLLLQLPIIIIITYYLAHNAYWFYPLWSVILIMIILLLIHPFRKLSVLYEQDELQLSEFFERLYEVIVIAPLSVLGRILWLTVDFLLIERTILNSISHLRNALINLSSKLHSCHLIGYILTAILGLMIMFIFWIVKL